MDIWNFAWNLESWVGIQNLIRNLVGFGISYRILRDFRVVSDPSHLQDNDGCQYEDMTCTNGCDLVLPRKYMANHVENICECRQVNCKYCSIAGECQFIEGEHKKWCPKLPLPCPNNCEVVSVPCEDMETHRKDCPLELI